jgi:hypothetical protein
VAAPPGSGPERMPLTLTALDWASNSLPWYVKTFVTVKVDDALAAVDDVKVASGSSALPVLAGGEDRT